MSDEKPAGITGTISGWIKAAVTSVIGLLSGAFIMYLTPVVNNAIKPAKPVANFATQASGLAVQFSNRSTGGVQGWWDFGDGSALEPFDPKLETAKHAYAKSGTYNVKLSLTSHIGEESDRTASVMVDADSVPRPEIASFQLIPLDKNERAPATYRLLSQVKNASFCLLSVGDSRPIEVIGDGASQERYITYDEMGSFTVRLAAVNGKQLVEQTKTIYVSPNDESEPTAKLQVVYEAVLVERLPRDWRMYCGWEADPKASVSPFRREHPADLGCTIVSAELVNKDDKSAAARNLKLEIAPDKSKVIVTGELVKPRALLAPKAPPPHWLAEVKVVMEHRSLPQTINRGDVTIPVNLNTAMKIPMQPVGDGWEIIRKQVSLQLWDGGRKVWEGSQAVANAKVTLNNKACLVTATPQSDSMLLRIDAPVGPIRPASFVRPSVLPKQP
jgi:PKD repeat protein